MRNEAAIDLLESWLNETPTQAEVESSRKHLAEIMVALMRVSVDARSADFVSVERLNDGIAIRIHGGEQDLGFVIGDGLAKELVHHLSGVMR